MTILNKYKSTSKPSLSPPPASPPSPPHRRGASRQTARRGFMTAPDFLRHAIIIYTKVNKNDNYSASKYEQKISTPQ